MIHSHALIKVACKIFGLFFLVNVVSLLAFTPQGIMMIQTDTSNKCALWIFRSTISLYHLRLCIYKICRRNRAKIGSC